MSFPKTARISWDANPTPELVTGYRVTQNGTLIGSTTTLSIDAPIDDPGIYTFGVSAVNAVDSGPEGFVVLAAVVPSAPINIQVVVL